MVRSRKNRGKKAKTKDDIVEALREVLNSEGSLRDLTEDMMVDENLERDKKRSQSYIV